MRTSERSPRSARGSRGGALPGIVGGALVSEVSSALARLPGVAVERNAVMRARLPSGAQVITGVGGLGAPDVFCEVPTPAGVRACLWLECKSGEGELSADQRKWHTRAAVVGRHVFTIRSVEQAVEIVRAFMRGEVVRGEVVRGEIVRAGGAP